MRHQTTADVAENINVLIEYLHQHESGSSRYIYRGQVREWTQPLIPSLFRRSISRERAFTDRSPEYSLALRGYGRRFVEMKPDSSLEKLVAESKDITSDEYETMISLANNPEFSIAQEKRGWDAALSTVIRPEKQTFVRKRSDLWRTIVEEMQRNIIMHRGFVQPFGYVLGMTLAQQYGFSSELIDFTSDLKVAAFFALHDGPSYLFQGVSLCKTTGSKFGVIYRLPFETGNIRNNRFDKFNYYSCPSQLHMRDIAMRFEDKSSPDMTEQWVGRLPPEYLAALCNGTIIVDYIDAILVEQEMRQRKFTLYEAIDKYLHLYYTGGGIRYYRLLDVQRGTFEHSRLGRQRAVLVVPDELRKTVKPDQGEHYATFQAVEDVSHRDGFERFYFHHTDVLPSIGEIDREHLWPSENDMFMTIVSRVLDPSTKTYYFGSWAIPKRLGLVSTGFR